MLPILACEVDPRPPADEPDATTTAATASTTSGGLDGTGLDESDGSGTTADPICEPPADDDGTRWVGVVIGPVEPTLADPAATHDAIEDEIAPLATCLGRVHHNPYVSIDDGSEVVLVDEWSSLVGATTLGADAAAQAALAELFQGSAESSQWTMDPEWTAWGETIDTEAAYLTAITGPLAGDYAAIREAHNANFQPELIGMVESLGYVAHSTLIDADQQRVFFLDVWEDQEAMLGFYANPDTRAVIDSYAAEAIYRHLERPTGWSTDG